MKKKKIKKNKKRNTQAKRQVKKEIKKQKTVSSARRKKKTIVGNWKMMPQTLREAETIFLEIRKTARIMERTETIICPPYVYINELKKFFFKEKLRLGAQDVFSEESGSFTGSITAEMVKSVGATHTIIGHSERRNLGDTDEIINKKITLALKQDLKIIICIGEKKRDDHGDYLSYIRDQIRKALKGVSRTSSKDILIAYEPVWAIGAEEAMQPHDVHQMVIFIKKTLIELFGMDDAVRVPILYGGSVTTKNAESIIYDGEADGLLIGRQSLDPDKFTEILKLIS